MLQIIFPFRRIGIASTGNDTTERTRDSVIQNGDQERGQYQIAGGMQERRTKPDGYRWGCPGRGGTKKFGDSTRGGWMSSINVTRKGLKTADKRTGLIDVLAVGVVG